MSKEIRPDVVVIGAGIAGLMTTHELTKKGYKTLLIERSDTLADGATTRNQRRTAGCLKPYITESDNTIAVDIRIAEGAPGYYYFIPGKMTATPTGVEKILYIAEHQESLKKDPLSLPDVTPRRHLC